MTITITTEAITYTTTTINISDLCYAVGRYGKDASGNGLDRSVGGFDLTFGGGQGVKCNGSSSLLIRHDGDTHGTITIAPTSANSSLHITGVKFSVYNATGSEYSYLSAGTGTLSNGTGDDANKIVWSGSTSSLTLTHTGSTDFYITAIEITTDGTPTFSKVTPSVTLSPTSSSVAAYKAGKFTTSATSTPRNFNWTWTPAYGSTNISVNTANGDPDTLVTTASTTTGSNTLTASYTNTNDANPWFNSAANAATYTLTVREPVYSGADNTYYTQTYPYTWDFSSSGSRWSTSQTQLTTTYDDWEGDGTYYHQTNPTAYTVYPMDYNIDVIKGLRFTNNTWIGLDWGYGHVWMSAGSITIPGLTAGQTVTFVMEGRADSGATTLTAANTSGSTYSIAKTDGAHASYVYTVTTGGDITFTFGNNVSIRSIAVSGPDLTGAIGIHGTKHYTNKNVVVGTSFSWDARQNTDQRLRLQLTNLRISETEALPSAYKSNAYFSVTSSNSSVINVDSYNVYSANDQSNGDGRAFCEVTVAGAGKATVTITYHGANGDVSAQQTFNISRIPICYNSTYPFTWDFQNYDWVGSEVQALKNTTYWDFTSGNTYVDIKGTTLVTANDIDMIWGLAGSAESGSPSNGFIRLNWGEKCMQVNGNVTVPSLTTDNIVTITTESDATVKVGGSSGTALTGSDGVFTYAVPSAGDVTFNVNDKKIYSIAVSQLPRQSVTFDYTAANDTLLNRIDKPVEDNEVTHIYANGVRLTAACAADSYNTVEFVKGSKSKTHVKWDGAAYLAVSSDRGVIRKVVFTLSGSKSQADRIAIDAGGGTGTYDTSAGTYTWTGDSSFVKFRATNNIDQLTSVYVEYVERTAISRFSPIGGTTTTWAYTAGNPSTNTTMIVNPVALANVDNFEVVFTSNRDVVAATPFAKASSITAADGRVHFYNGVTRGNPGTAEVYYRFKGTSEYAGMLVSVNYTINKADQELAFADNNAAQTQSYSANGSFDHPATHSVGDGAVTYTSSDEYVATVSSSGVVTFLNSGVTTITATAASTDYYNAATASYQLTVNGTDGTIIDNLAWDTSNFPIPTTIAYGNNANVRATTTDKLKSDNTTTPTIKYRSSNTSIATVEDATYNLSGTSVPICKINPVGNGTVTITAYVEGVGNYNPKEITTSDITIVGDTLGLSFLHGAGKVTVGQTLTPYVKVPNAKWADFTSVTVTTSDASIATVGAGNTSTFDSSVTLTTGNGGVTELGGDIQNLFPTIKGVAVGSATITITLVSTKYKQTVITYNVQVVSDALHFDWETPSQVYTLYTGDYMMMPAITGNANGNWDYSKGETCETKQAYLYGIRSGTPIWNYADFKVGEGYPNYRLTERSSALDNDQKSSMTNATDMAYIIWATSQNTSDDTLMIYGNKAGTVYLHAFDAQTGSELSPITINIIDKNTLADAVDTYVQDMTYPYTWDFTKDFTVTTSPNYWEPHYNSSGTLDYYICGYSTMFNWDYCDQDNDGSMNEALGNVEAVSPYNKYFVSANSNSGLTNVMPQFYGMTIYSGNSGDTRTKSYETKRDKLRLLHNAGEGKAHLSVVGGVHYLRLPNPATSNVIEGDNNFKIVIKASPIREKCTLYKFKNGDHGTDGNGTATWKEITGESFVMFDVNRSEMTGDNYIELGIDNVSIYWIAMTTEAKAIPTAKGASGTGSEQMASYSYGKAIDYNKSFELNNVDAYVATSVSVPETGSPAITVTMTKADTPLESGTGVVLRTHGGVTPSVWTFEKGTNTENNNTFAKDHTVKSSDNKELSVATNKFGQVKYEGSSVTVNGVSYTKCLNLEGNLFATKNCRYVKFNTSDPVTITIVAASEQNSGTKLRIGKGVYNDITQLAEFDLTSTSAVFSYTYSGDPTDIFIYSYDSRDTTPDGTNNDSGHGYGMKIYSINVIGSSKTAYMFAHTENVETVAATNDPNTNLLIGSIGQTLTVYQEAGDEEGTTQGSTYIPFILSSTFKRTATGNTTHNAGYFSFWRIWSSSVTVGPQKAYLVLPTGTYTNVANAWGKAADITGNMVEEANARGMMLRFVDDSTTEIPSVIEGVEADGVSEDRQQQGDDYYYDLRGMRVDSPTKGLFIRNGKKIWIK